MSEEQVCEFVDLLNHEEDYEILNVWPFTIRRKRDHYVVKESIASNGYPRVNLNCKAYYKHRLVSEQFLINDDPEHKTQVDHKNKDRTDYHLENLRFVSNSDNQKNKTAHKGVEYVFVGEISDESIIVNSYGRHEFENYFYDETVDKFYFYNGIQYRELYINEFKNGLKYVWMITTENKQVKVFYTKFKKLYGFD